MFGTCHICEQRSFRRECTFAQYSQGLCKSMKRRDVDEGSVKMYKPVQENLVLNAYASS